MNALDRRPEARTAATLAARLADLLRTEQQAMAEFLVALADFDRRRGWAELGYATLWSFLHRDLGLSAGAAYHRKAAAELLQRCPAIEVPLRDGRLCLSSVVELSKVLAPGNEAEVLPRFFHRSAREAKEVVAELQPREVAPVREVVTALATGPGTEAFHTSESPREGREATESATPVLGVESSVQAAPANPACAPPRDAVEPLTADLRRLHVTVSRRFLDKLDAARAARSHAQPSATAEAILEEALDLLLAREAKRREAATERPPATPRDSASDRIPAHVRREVWGRDEGRCTWPLHDGGRCGSTHRLELDHVVPKARGGASTADNLRLLCGAHNAEAARRVFGAGWMARKLADASRARR
jgi:5-methylcytosine-specific restriction endonuclease McrA